MDLKVGTLAHKGHPNYILPRNDRQFSKRVYTMEDGHTGESKPYMRASIDFAFDGGNYLDLKKEMHKNEDVRALISQSER